MNQEQKTKLKNQLEFIYNTYFHIDLFEKYVIKDKNYVLFFINKLEIDIYIDNLQDQINDKLSNNLKHRIEELIVYLNEAKSHDDNTLYSFGTFCNWMRIFALSYLIHNEETSYFNIFMLHKEDGMFYQDPIEALDFNPFEYSIIENNTVYIGKSPNINSKNQWIEGHFSIKPYYGFKNDNEIIPLYSFENYLEYPIELIITFTDLLEFEALEIEFEEVDNPYFNSNNYEDSSFSYDTHSQAPPSSN